MRSRVVEARQGWGRQLGLQNFAWRLIASEIVLAFFLYYFVVFVVVLKISGSVDL